MSVLGRRYMLGMSVHQGESTSQSTASAWSRGVPLHSLCSQLQTRRPVRLQLSQNFEPRGGSFILSRFDPCPTLSVGFSQQEAWRAIHSVAFNRRLLLFSPRAGASGDFELCLFNSFVDFRCLTLLAASRALHSGFTGPPPLPSPPPDQGLTAASGSS